MFARDAFRYDSTEPDLMAAVAYEGAHYALHLPSSSAGLTALLGAAQALELPFAPVAMTGADVDGDNAIDLLAVAEDGRLAAFANTSTGLEPLALDVVVDSGKDFVGITAIESPALAGEERVFVAGRQGIWKSDPLDNTGIIHFDEMNPALTDVALPAAFFAAHDDGATWYIGLAHGTAVDLWSADTFDRGPDLIAFESPSAPTVGHWRRLSNPLAVLFFGIVNATNRVVWLSLDLINPEDSGELDPMAEGPLRDLTSVEQPDGYDLITLSHDPDGRVGVQVSPLVLTDRVASDPPLSFSQNTSIDTTTQMWVRAAGVTATPFVGHELLVFDEVGHILCLEFDADHTALQSCDEADMRDLIGGWTQSP